MPFQIYAHYLDNKCIYVGCGNEKRPYDFYRRNVNWKKIVGDRKPTVVILDQKETFEEALQCEKYHIARLKNSGHELANKPVARYWLGKKRDPKLIDKLVKSAHTPEAREKRRLSSIGRKHSEEHKRKIGEAHKNIERTQEWKDAISAGKKGRPNGLKGRVMPESHRKAISEATKGRRPLTPEEQEKRLATWKDRGGTSSKAKAVICIDTGVKYRCAKEAAEATKSDAKHIQACCVGRRKTHNKLTWKYA